MYWVHDSISQFYHVHVLEFNTCCHTIIMINCVVQMSERAGRDGSTSVCHLFVNSKQVKSIKDEAIKSHCSLENKENCRRRDLLDRLGDDSRFVCDPENVVTKKSSLAFWLKEVESYSRLWG